MENTSRILTLIPGFLFGLTLHEFSHAWAATRLGDPTARRLGRLSLNPLAHLDLFGSLALIFIGFGWAKPVPVDPNYLRSPRRDMALIAAAGPVSNLLIAIVLAALARLALVGSNAIEGSVSTGILILVQAVWINIVLAIFNLIPLPPLDGSRVLAGIVPETWNHGYEQVERFGPMILFGVIILASVTGISILGRIIMPVAEPVFRWFMGF
ncbi:MAG: site-2 protease family protein [Calditrichota bacterium]